MALTSSGAMDFILISVINLLFLTTNVLGNDILGCGGFVKSHANLDFSKIEVGLYTKQGTLKEKTECAPTNGYYFLPLYEKGDYVLKVHPPAGWSFEPSVINLSVDGETDQCSTGQDINFSFNGFGIAGQVITASQTKGPSGISVQLVNEKGEVRETVTSANGDFHFTPVIPGKYTVKASHPRWKLDPHQAAVQVKEGNTALPVGVLAVKGYDVRGSVTSHGSSMSGVYVLLYSKEERPKFRVEGCNTALLQGVPDAPICHVITDANGEFKFGLVPYGEYKLLALNKNPGQATVTYNIKPQSVAFSVKHDSLFIKNAFEVTSFSVVGSVISSPGTGISGARVLLDGKPVATTDATGRFTLTELSPGSYLISVQHANCEFEDTTLTVTATGPLSAPLVAAARWRVCGDVTPAPRDVTVGRSVVKPSADGKWCTFLVPGEYIAKVDVTEQEQRKGLQFYPPTHKISVSSSPVSGISFSQLKATVTGVVACAAPACRALTVSMRPQNSGTTQYATVKDGKYTFTDVIPGTIEVSVPTEQLCWEAPRHVVTVAQSRASVPDFKHTGYPLIFVTDFPTEIDYVSGTTKGTFSTPGGSHRQCVDKRDKYTFTPRGCHRFEPASAQVDTAAADLKPITFTATSHANTIRVLSPVPAQDLTLRLAGAAVPLRPAPHADGGYVYEHVVYLAEGEVLVVSASSPSLLFQPSAAQLLGARDCGARVLLRGVRAVTLTGKLLPPVGGATVTVTGENIKLTQVTEEDGAYSFGPLDASQRYSISVEKESFVFSEPDAAGNIIANKLASITVLLTDENGTPLQGALVSVSGGSYRRTSASGTDGVLVFPSLSPAQYYIRPHMKEYKFDPPHSTATLAQGESYKVTLKGVRYLWSCVGRVAGVGGAAVRDVTVRALSEACAPEEATTAPSGSFRIRGLRPGCKYTLELKDDESLRLKLVKAPAFVEITDNKDVEDVRLIAVQPGQLTDGSVRVRARLEHYRALRLALRPEPARAALYAAKLDPAGYSQTNNPGLMYALPRLPADNASYVLTVESSLSRASHSYEDMVYYFTSDGQYKHFDIVFDPKVKLSEQELRQTSLLVIPLLGLLVFAYFQSDKILDFVTKMAAAQSRPIRAIPVKKPDILDKASIDQIVSSVNATGKKVKAKKVQ